MKTRKPTDKFWAGTPPWIIIGAVAVMVPIFALMTYENIHRQKENSARLLLEKGAALIRSIEAGTRTEVMGIHWDSFQLQQLLIQTAQQSDIAYLMVTDSRGRIVAHSNPANIGRLHRNGADLAKKKPSSEVTGHLVALAGGGHIFEVMGKFSPTGSPWNLGPGSSPFHRRFQVLMQRLNVPASDSWHIFVGLDTSTIEAARRADTRQTIVMGVVLLLIGFAGIVLLFLAQSYRTTRASLSKIKAFSDNLVENMPIGLVALDTEKRVAAVNQAASAMLRLLEITARGKHAETILPSQFNELISTLDTASPVSDCQIDCRLADGREIPMELTATMLASDTGVFFGYALLFKDLSEMQALRKEVARSQRLATVGRLAAGVAHEIRNPLSSIKGFATYFKERHPDIDEDQQIAGIMIQEVDKLNCVVGQLLEFARPVKIKRQWTPVKPLIENSLKLVEKTAKDKGIKIDCTLLPETLEGFLDADRMHQVLLNLYLNALDAMGNGGELKVIAKSSPDNQGILIQVVDTGTGIALENLSSIFDLYFTTKPSGTGLGLAIVHNIIEAHHGRITPDSSPDRGTAMTIFLPAPKEKKTGESAP